MGAAEQCRMALSQEVPNSYAAQWLGARSCRRCHLPNHSFWRLSTIIVTSRFIVSAQSWLAHASSWETLLTAWDEGVHTVMWPGIPMPYKGLRTALEW